MSKQKVNGKSISRISHFAAKTDSDDKELLQKEPSVELNDKSQKKSVEGLQMSSEQMIQVIQEQELKVIQNKSMHRQSKMDKHSRRNSIDSIDNIDSDMESDEDEDSEGDDLSHFQDLGDSTPSQSISKKNELPAQKELDNNAKNREPKLKKVETIRKKKGIKKEQERIQKEMAKHKQEYQIDDFTIQNSVGRNILHRSCLKQNHQMVEDLLRQFLELKSNEEAFDKQGDDEANTQALVSQPAKEKLAKYVNELDSFGNSPLILCCVLESSEECKRKECIMALIGAGADVNHRNPRTLWSSVHWCAHYGDFECMHELLAYSGIATAIQKNIQFPQAYLCFPDREGFFPIDISGKRKQGKVSNLMIQHLIGEIKEIEKNQNKENQENELFIYSHEQDKEFMRKCRVKYLSSPLLKSRLLFWAAFLPIDKSIQYIKDIFGFNQTYVMAMQNHQNNVTSLHAAAWTEKPEIIEFLVSNILCKNNPEKLQWIEQQNDERVNKVYTFSISNNTILSLVTGEESLYKRYFITSIKSLAIWENKFILDQRKIKQTGKNPYIDQQDDFGNTALHYASIKGFVEGVQAILKGGADMEVDNKECWRPRELVQHISIRQLYHDAMEHNQGMGESLKEMIKELEVIIRKYNELENGNPIKCPIEKDLYKYGTRLFLPDFIIVFNLGQDKFGESNQNRMNFQIDIIRKSNFNVYLLESVMPDKYYLLIGMPEVHLQSACKQNKMQMKLIDSYDYEPFNLDNITKFEPFRSKQRQEIIEMQLNKIVNLQDLKSQKLISSYYKMHTYGGISRVKFQWVDDTRWYWPQPLNQWDDYLLEAKNQNFTSVTLLRQYFGEKIAFYFGWKSFITCFLILIAFPGLALQIYIIQEKSDDYNNLMVPYWVFYVMIWSTVIVEFWKRKTSEINYRWGTLDMMNNPDILNKQLREDFIGDEYISAVTGALTKYQKQSKTVIFQISIDFLSFLIFFPQLHPFVTLLQFDNYIYIIKKIIKFLISIPVLAGLMFLVVYIFLIVDAFKKSFTSGAQAGLSNNLLKTFAGALQGVGIQVLNYVYTFIARKFANYENHKYVFQYERSIIYKLMAFKVLNSYFALFYVAFLQKDSNFSTLFFMLLPILLVKQINYTLFNVWMPLFFYNRSEKNYFMKVNSRIIEHQLCQGQKDPSQMDNYDVIETFWNNYSKQDMLNLNRSIISLAQENDEKDKKVEVNDPLQPSIKLIRHIDVDSIELNSLRGEFLDTINFYSDGFIDLGYITLFASAFPIGPFICLIMNSLEIRNKINGFMYILKRPTCQRSAGIGEWLVIWQTFSFVSVVNQQYFLEKG